MPILADFDRVLYSISTTHHFACEYGAGLITAMTIQWLNRHFENAAANTNGFGGKERIE